MHRMAKVYYSLDTCIIITYFTVMRTIFLDSINPRLSSLDGGRNSRSYFEQQPETNL